MSEVLAASPIGHALGWALLQLLWQGSVIGTLTALALLALRHSTANRRYVVACAGLLAMVVTFVATMVMSAGEGGVASAGPDVTWSAAMPAVSGGGLQAPLPSAVFRPADAAAAAPWWSRQRLEAWSPFVVPAWLLGVLLLSARLVTGWLLVERLRRRSNRPVAELWRQRLEAVASQLGIAHQVRLLESGLVSVPTLVGWLRPVILFPASTLAGLSVAQMEAIIAHELAHVRRHDYLVNVLQSTIEILLFYHPATWWISRQIRVEREHCCDDIAAAFCTSRLAYARALADLETLRGANPALGLAATDGSLIKRIRRILRASAVDNTTSPTWSIAASLATILVLGFAAERARGAIPEGAPAPQSVAAPSGQIMSNEGILRGQVLDEQSGDPVFGATVTLACCGRSGRIGPSNGRQAVTGLRGTYEIDVVAPGEYLVEVRARGYVATLFGQAAAAMAAADANVAIPVQIRGGQMTSEVNVRLARSAAVSGRILADSGEGLVGAEVELLRKVPQADGTTLVTVALDQTKSLGAYTFGGVPAGEYYVRAYAPPPIRPARGTPSAVYVSTLSSKTIAVRPGQDVLDVDFGLATAEAHVVSGTLVDIGGPTVAKASVELVPLASRPDNDRPRAAVARDGRFELRGVVPGDYVLTVQDETDAGRWIGVRRPVTVFGDVANLEVTPARGTHIDGRLLQDGGGTARFNPRGVEVRLESGPGARTAGTSVLATRPELDGTFSIDSPVGGASLVVSGLSFGWFVKSARLDGVDITDRALEMTGGTHRLEVVVTDRVSRLLGTVTDQANRPAPYALVVVFPEDRARWTSARLIRARFSQQEGRYEVDDLPSADYRAVAVQSLPREAWKDPAVLARLWSLATPVRLGEGQERSVSLKLSSMPQGASRVVAPRFDVASVKPCKDEPATGGQRRAEFTVAGGRANIICLTLQRIIFHAYAGVGNLDDPLLNVHPSNPDLVRGGPSWLGSDKFTIEATAEGAPDRTVMMGPMLRALLEDRFQLRIHREFEDGPLYALTVAKGGLKMQPLGEGGCTSFDVAKDLSRDEILALDRGSKPICGNFTSLGDGANRTWHLGGESLTRFANQILSSVLDRYVIDKTGVSGIFNIHLEFGLDESIRTGVFGGRGVNPPRPDIPRGASIFTALEDQLGLKIENTRGPSGFLVIDRVERPSEN